MMMANRLFADTCWWMYLAMLLCLVVLAPTAAAQARLLEESPPGEYVSSDPSFFADVVSLPGDEPWVATYYFYWYNVMDGYHLYNSDGSDALQDHPVNMDLLSWCKPEWHKQELQEMAAVGIDVLLPVYWGSPANATWTYGGLQVLARALEEMEAAGQSAPKVGMFLDTSALRQVPGGADLSTERGKTVFYRMIRDFFSAIPPRFWAAVDGQPIVFVYTSAFASRYDETLFPYVKENFASDFGGLRPFIVAEISWTVPTDMKYRWGAALGGPSFFGVAAVGPGYNDSAVPGRTTPIKDRQDGQFYEDSWKQVLARRPQAVVIETWNEFHEGTEIAETREHGRLYLDLTREYVGDLKSGVAVELPASAYTDVDEISTKLGASNEDCGLQFILNDDGLVKPDEALGEEGLRPVPNPYGGLYLYFQVDDGFLSYADDQQVVVTVRYFDEGVGSLSVQYDSRDPKALLDGAYKPARSVGLKGTQEWHEAEFPLPDPFFAGRQNVSADFRLSLSTDKVLISEVRVRIAE